MVTALREAADPVRAPQQRAYMKSAMPCLGVTVPECRRIAGSVFKAHPMPDAPAWEAAILDLWRNAARREERYAAIELLLFKRYSSWIEPARVPRNTWNARSADVRSGAAGECRGRSLASRSACRG